MNKIARLNFVILFAIATLFPLPLIAENKNSTTIVLASGNVRGLYFSFAAGLCEQINRKRYYFGLRCVVEATSGSVENLRLLNSGFADFAIIQNDVFSGMDIEDSDHRILLPLFQEALHIIVHADSDIGNFSGIDGRILGIPGVESGTETLVNKLIELGKVAPKKILRKPSFHELIQRFCFRQVDAIIFVAGENNEFSREAVSRCNAKIVGVSDPTIAKAVSQIEGLSSIKLEEYPGSKKVIQSVGPLALLIVGSSVDPSTENKLVKAIEENSDELTRLHPTFEKFPKNLLLLQNR